MFTPYYDQDGITIYHGDCREILPQLVPVDHVISDPPYDARTHANARKTRDDRIAIDFAPLDVAPTVAILLPFARRWCICFCTMEMLGAYRDASGAAWIRAGFWKRHGAPQFTGDRPAQPGEAIAIMHRTGKKRWNGGGLAAFYEHNNDQVRFHPTEKPESLMREIVALFTDAGEMILDPFMGSGTTLVAAKRLGRKAIGIELDEKYCEIAAKRLQQGALDLFQHAPEQAEAIPTHVKLHRGGEVRE